MKTLPLLLLLSPSALFAGALAVPTTPESLAAHLIPSHNPLRFHRLSEWGTFTSVSGSDGKVLEGVENDVEPLPWFVHSHDGMSAANSRPNLFSKGLGLRPLKGVTVKMETPVIYFYANKKFDAEVSVGFRGGSISQWYPTRSGGETVPFRGVNQAAKKFEEGAMDFTKPFDGSIQWKVSVEPRPADWAVQVYHPGETPVWMYPRLPASNLVRTADGQAETYLFYRGVGRFETPVSAVFQNDDSFTVTNSGPDAIPGLMVYELTREGTVRWKNLGTLAPSASLGVGLDWQVIKPADKARLEVHQDLAQMLRDNGLTSDEADAMILTWHSSYFATPGLRLFWVCPRAFTDTILPLSVQPQPAKLDRVILGRLELLSPKWERELVALAAKADAAQPKEQHPYAWDRHWPAYANRLAQLRPTTASSTPVSQPLPITIPFRLPE